MTPDVCVVLGTFNRIGLLQKALASFRRSCGRLNYEIVVVDGGSTDGSLEWLDEQPRVHVIRQSLPLTGAVAAFNLGFGYAVDIGARYVCILNDDDEMIGPRYEIEMAYNRMERDAYVGAVAFETDLRGPWECECWNGRPYCNKGVIRREAGMAAARAAGDPTGRAWWSRDHLTYASDTELGLWIWRLGWTVEKGVGLRVHDNADAHVAHCDDLRKNNVKLYAESGTVKLFHQRWDDPNRIAYDEFDAIRYGGRVR